MGGSKEYLNLLIDDTNFYNHVVLGTIFPASVWKPLPHFLQTWLRNYVGIIFLYLITGFLWSFYIYCWKRNVYVPQAKAPTNKTMLLQIGVAMKAMHWYGLLPSITEYMIENGWTRCFSRISEVGWLAYLVYTLIYFAIVELGVYGIHRMLHDIKPLFKYVHAKHHSYNKETLLSPFAGMASNPLDGVLQAMPHVIAIFVVPIHLTTHIVFLFLEVIWTTSVHDCIDDTLWPLMGAGFHTIHHCANQHNYGHFTMFTDLIFGTLRTPSKEESKKVI